MTPFERYPDYLGTGLGDPIKLPHQGKFPPPSGVTGFNGRPATQVELDRWRREGGNLGIRLAPGVLGLDFDGWGGKPGLENRQKALDRLGALPPTYTLTSRSDGSHKAFYRVPEGRVWREEPLGAGIEVLSWCFRYAMVWPSEHPDGGIVAWYGLGGGLVNHIPNASQLAELPAAWVAELDNGTPADRATRREICRWEADAFIEALPDGPICQALRRKLDEWVEPLAEDRHNTARSGSLALVTLGNWGHRGAEEALAELHDAFLVAADDGARKGDPEREWSRMLKGAVGLKELLPDNERNCCGEDVESWRELATDPKGLMIPVTTEQTTNGSAPEHTTNGSAPANDSPAGEQPVRRLVMRKASTFVQRPVRWAWDTSEGPGKEFFAEGRFPVGSLVIAAGRAGTGKSQFACWQTARITTGTLPGQFFGKPRSVIYCATEDSWEMTIAPRLTAAGADLDRVYHLAVVDHRDKNATLTLPVDTEALEQAISDHDVAMVVMDPLLSLLDTRIDDYRSREVRTALEPLIAVADRTHAVLLGLAHFTKATGNDPLLLVSGSGAFGQLVRAAVACMRDEEADTRAYVMSTIKNNLGRDDLPSMGYVIEPTVVETPGGTANVSRLVFTGTSERSVRDLLVAAPSSSPAQGAQSRREVDRWLEGYLTENGNKVEAQKALEAAVDAGFTVDQAKRAKKRLLVDSKRTELVWFWVARAYVPCSLAPLHSSQVNPGLAPAPLGAPLDAQMPPYPNQVKGAEGGTSKTGSDVQRVQGGKESINIRTSAPFEPEGMPSGHTNGVAVDLSRPADDGRYDF